MLDQRSCLFDMLDLTASGLTASGHSLTASGIGHPNDPTIVYV